MCPYRLVSALVTVGYIHCTHLFVHAHLYSVYMWTSTDVTKTRNRLENELVNELPENFF